MARSTEEIGWDDVNLQDPDKRAKFMEQELERALGRRRKVVADLEREGLIDSQGRRVRKDTPPIQRCFLSWTRQADYRQHRSYC